MEFSQSIFEKYINQALDSLPKRFSTKIENTALVFDDETQPKNNNQIILANILRSNFYPNKITFFKKNIEMVSPNEKILAKNLHHIVYHEIGHYFGMSEEQLRKKEQPINIYEKSSSSY